MNAHFSLRWMFGFVSFLAIGCGLLFYATPFLSRLTLTLTLVVLLASVLAAVCHTGKRRMFWTGFAFFGLSYGWAVCGSWQAPGAEGLLCYRLATTSILEWCHDKAPHTRSLTTAQSPAGMTAMAGGYGSMMMPGAMGGMPASAPGGGMGPPAMTTVTQAPDWSDFATTGHSLFALAFAMLGGLIATRCYEKAKAKPGGSS